MAMALFTISAMRERAQREVQRSYKLNAEGILSDLPFNKFKTYDIFLSHSSLDAPLILGVKATLEDLGYSVYVDWVNDPQLDRSKVNRATAQLLRDRMSVSNSLFYVTTDNAVSSKWMPWECGYFDGFKEKVAILPVIEHSYDNEFKGQEYLDLYPYCLKTGDNYGVQRLWIYKDKDYYLVYETWIQTKGASLVWKKI